MSGPLASISEVRLAALVESSSDAIVTKDRDAIITSWNPAAERMFGYSEAEAVGRPISIIIPPERVGEERRILERVLAGEQLAHYESERVARSGNRLRVSLSVSPLREGDDVVGASVISRDVTGAHRSREFASRLHELTVALSREISRDGAIRCLLDQVVGALGADAGTVGILDTSRDEIELVGSAGHTPEGLGDWGRFPLDADVPMSIAVRTGQPVWTESSEELTRRYADLTGARIRFASLAVIPLTVDRPFGAVSLSFASPHRFDAEERTFLVTAVQQAAQTLDRARLYEAERLGVKRLSFLAAAGELLSRSLDPDTTLRSFADLAIREIADWCAVDLVDDRGGIRNVATAHVDPSRVRLAEELRERYPVDPGSTSGVPGVIRTGEPELYPEVPDELLVESAIDEDHLRLIRELGLVSAMVVPLRARDRTLGAITFVSSESARRYDSADLELANDLARRAALAIDNSMLFQREHRAAVTLQRSLLPPSLPRITGIDVAARYEPATPSAEVGGDWYDVVRLDERTVVMTIGDVAGRGVEAAAVMGGVSSTLKAYVLDGKPPSEALAGLNRMMRDSSRPQMATVFHLQLDVESGWVEYVRAGHPPALLRHSDGKVELLSGGGTQPLGVFDEIDLHSARIPLPPGALLFLYTDGLIERSDRDFDAELDRLCATLAAGPDGAGECLEALARSYGAESVPDDVTMLGVARS